MFAIFAWQMGSVQITEYMLLNGLALLFMSGLAWRAARQYAFSRSSTSFFIAGLWLVFVAGARIAHIMFYTQIGSFRFFTLLPHGFSLFGGLLFSVIYFCCVAWFKNIPLWNWLDGHAPALMSYVVLGKIGCFINGCCFGLPTIMPWGVAYAPGSQAFNYYVVGVFDNISRQPWQVYSDLIHPVQLYESGIALILLLLALLLLRKKVLPGAVFLLTAGIYSLARLGLFYLRAFPETGTFFYALPWMYFIIAILCLGMFLVKLVKRRTRL